MHSQCESWGGQMALDSLKRAFEDVERECPGTAQRLLDEVSRLRMGA
ncbi:hypothetical protein BC936DRAFT_144876 [Jimgerdemannia flammicorona]|nr:hypothetical protein BC936DRAFT_144876 [Jimgerdemannia flammicorona]